MLLTIDIGNTNIKSALFENGILSDFKLHTTTDNFLNYANSVSFSEAAFSSVVPSKSALIENEFSRRKKIYRITSDSMLNIKISYNPPSALGTDRICSCEGALSLLKNSHSKHFTDNSCIVTIDLGTATTINVVRYPGVFIGGIIAPGTGLMKIALNDKTAQLPDVDLNVYQSALGTDTNSSIASGIINSTVGLVERSLNQIREKQKQEITGVYITGGNSDAILPHFKFEFVFEKALVLYGIEAVYRNVITKQ